MTLRNIVIPKMVISVGGESLFAVSGIYPNQVFGLYKRHREDLSSVFDSLSGRETALAQVALDSIEGIVAQFPDLIAEIIALASGGDPDDYELFVDKNTGDTTGQTVWEADVAIAKRLPFPVQLDALMKIGELTFSTEMPPGKFFALLVGMIQRLNNSRQPLPTGSES